MRALNATPTVHFLLLATDATCPAQRVPCLHTTQSASAPHSIIHVVCPSVCPSVRLRRRSMCYSAQSTSPQPWISTYWPITELSVLRAHASNILTYLTSLTQTRRSQRCRGHRAPDTPIFDLQGLINALDPCNNSYSITREGRGR